MLESLNCRTLNRCAACVAILAVILWIGLLLSPGAGRAQNNLAGFPGAQVVLRGFELSGSAIVQGGILIADDELISSVLFLDKAGVAAAGRGMELGARIVKLERKRTKSKPFTDKDSSESLQDFEGIASDRDKRVFLLGSHQGMEGDRRTDREFIVQAEWDTEKRELEFKDIYRNLLTHAAPLLAKAGAGITLTDTKCTPEVNIEALAFNGGKLYIGLRAPLGAGGKAIMLTADADDLFAKKFKGSFDLMLVALGGGGFRGMDWDPVSKRLLIVSGHSTDAPGPMPALHALDPATGAIEVLHSFTKFELTNPLGVPRGSPEGVSRLEDGRLVLSLNRTRGAISEVIYLPAAVGIPK